jgi:UDP:flavonoid glycosyltransferase YjiC (YdhE family)
MITGKRVLCGAEPDYGHTLPALALAIDFRKMGNQLKAISVGERMNHVFEEYGVETAPTARKGPGGPDFGMVPILQDYKPDITICDASIPLWWAVLVQRPKCRISILRCEFLLGYRRRNLFAFDKFPFADVGPINRVFQQLGMKAIRDRREFCRAEIVAIPSVPEIDPLPEGYQEIYPDTSFVYTGPLLLKSGSPLSNSLRDWLSARRQNGVPILLITLGTAWGSGIYTMLADSLMGNDWAIIMVVPEEEERRSLQERNGPWLQVVGFTDLMELTELVDVVMHHCGHATLQTAVLAGKPSLTLPSGHYDREDNALRLEDLGCGRYLGHDFFRRGLNPAAISAEVKSILLDSAIHASVRGMSGVLRDFREKRGPGELMRALAAQAM